MTLATTPVEVLEMGLEIIKEKGWTQDTIMDRDTGAVCALGAIQAATYGFNSRTGYIRTRGPKGTAGTLTAARKFLNEAVRRRLKGEADTTTFGFVSYNDEMVRTAAQIKSLFRSAIKAAQKAAAQA